MTVILVLIPNPSQVLGTFSSLGGLVLLNGEENLRDNDPISSIVPKSRCHFRS